jgi:histidinol phosphatase-like PHP family hydrolase
MMARTTKRRPTRTGGSRGGSGASRDWPVDHNIRAAGWLLDLAAIQDHDRRRYAYRRAAYAVIALTGPVADAVAAGTLGEVPFIGPASARVVTEYVQRGSSPTVERAIEGANAVRTVAAHRELRHGFVSHWFSELVLAAPLPGVVSLDDYTGDFQMHSTGSDGRQTLEEIVESGLALGYVRSAVTDHSYGLPIARGMSMEAAMRQHAAIDALNERHRGRFRLYKGIEANILADGTLDLKPPEAAVFEMVVASPHSALRSQHDQTARMVTAVSTPGVHILGHPRGRRFDVRPGVRADWGAVFRAAADHEVAIEIDGFFDRQDVDCSLAAQALESGCLFALDSDGHNARELWYARMAVAHARLAAIPADRVVNCWSEATLDEWLARRKGAAAGSKKSSRRRSSTKTAE